MQARDDHPNGPPSNAPGPGRSSTTSDSTSTTTSAVSSTTIGGAATVSSATTTTTGSSLTPANTVAASSTSTTDSTVTGTATPATANGSLLAASQLTGSQLAGSQISGSASVTPAAATSPDNASLGTNNGYAGNGVSGGTIAAAVIVPLLVFGCLAAAIFFLGRRRRQKNERAAMFVQNMTQQDPPRLPIHEHYNLAPMAAGVGNPAYFTGLDTSSDRASSHNTPFTDEPPPPYGTKGAKTAAAVPIINEPVSARSESASVLSFRTAQDDPDMLAAADSEQRSITSTAYSDNASVHSARAARMSVGGAQIISTAVSRDPFDDPESPVSSVDGDESRSLSGHSISRIDRVVSPFSMSSRQRL